jgi:hypothetical protein
MRLLTALLIIIRRRRIIRRIVLSCWRVQESIPTAFRLVHIVDWVEAVLQATRKLNATVILWSLTCICLDTLRIIDKLTVRRIDDDRCVTILDDVTEVEVIERTSHLCTVGIYCLKNEVKLLLETTTTTL